MADILIRQKLEFESHGYLRRDAVVRGIAEVRHRMERDHNPEFLLPPVDPNQLILEICRAIGLEPMEIIEAAGAKATHEELYRRIVPGELPITQFESWWEQNRDSVYEASPGQDPAELVTEYVDPELAEQLKG